MDALAFGDGLWIAVEESSAAGHARRTAVQLAHRVGFSETRAGEVAIAATELATNLARHARKGTLLLRVRRDGDDAGIELLAVDSGPGVHDMSVLLADGISTRGTLGIGLGAVARLANTFDLYSLPKRGTVISAMFWSRNDIVHTRAVASLTRPMNGQDVCGDAWSVRDEGGTHVLMLADGLGHGELAARASREAVRAFQAQSGTIDPERSVLELDSALHSTRGAAIAVLTLDREQGVATFAGIGNISAFIDDGERRSGFASTPGIAGTRSKRARPATLPFPKHGLAVMHSDGLSPKWDLLGYPGLRGRDKLVIAGTIFRDAAIHHDDASVLVA